MNSIVQNAPRQKMTFQANKLFGVKAPDSVTITGYAPGHGRQEHVRKPNPNYFFSPLTEDLHAWHEHMKRPLMVFGPTGCGKSSTIIEFYSRLNIPLHRVNGSIKLEDFHLEGKDGIKGGDTGFEYGPLALAMIHGEPFLLDEADRCKPELLVWLNTVLDGEPLTIAANGGEEIRPAKGFRFIATANTPGDGGMSTKGSYVSAQRQDAASIDRFDYIKADYQPKEIELQILLASYKIDKQVAEKMIDVATSIRKAYEADDIEMTFSLRSLQAWIEWMMIYARKPNPFMYSLDRAFGNALCAESRMLLEENVKKVGLIDDSSIQGGN